MATHEEIRRELKRVLVLAHTSSAIIKSLHEQGIRRVVRERAQVVVTKPKETGPRRYGYTDAHRRLEPEQTYPGCTTNAEWVVERTHAWNERARRLIMHHDRLPRVSEAWIWLT
jgi:transposase